MRKFLIAMFVLIPLISTAQFSYPNTRTVDSSDTWHGVTVADPYRWLEDIKNAEVQKWFKDQADFTNKYMSNLKYTGQLYNEFLKVDSIEPDNIRIVRQVGGQLFYFNEKTGDSKPKIYKRGVDSDKEELIAEAGMWGDRYTIVDYEIDPYQKYIAISASESGNEFKSGKIYSIEDNRFLDDTISGCFAGFGSGIGNVIYYQMPSLDVHVTVAQKEIIFMMHTLGSKPSEDKVYFSFDTNPEFYSDDNSYGPYPISYNINFKYDLMMVASASPFIEIYFRPARTNERWKKIISFEDKVPTVNGNENMLYFTSFNNTPNGKLMMMDMKNPELRNAILLAGEKDIPLQVSSSVEGALSQSKNFLILPYLKNGVQIITDVIDLRNNIVSKIPFSDPINFMDIVPFNKSNDHIHILRSGWISPNDFTYANLDNPSEGEKIFSFRSKTRYPYTDELVVEEIEIRSEDGVMLPVSLIYKKDLKRDGRNMTFVTGYGAYAINSSAHFNTQYLILAHMGIVVAVAHVRGGGEKGESWHLAAKKQNKCNTWKDMNSCAEYLINNGFTSSKHLVCEGSSSGGIMVGRAITERPDLWACAIPRVGCLSMLRYEFTPNGPGNINEFGTVKNINEFFGLMEMDATMHVVKGTKYPAMLITTGWNDPRVISWVPAKFAAAVQKATSSGKPALLYVDYTSGHFNSDDKFAQLRQIAESFAFAMEQCGYEDRSIGSNDVK